MVPGEVPPASRNARAVPLDDPDPDMADAPSPKSSADAMTQPVDHDRPVVCDLAPLGVLAIAGADAGTFLQGQLSCDVKGLVPGTWCYGSFNSPKGRMLANFVLWRSQAAADRFEMLLSGDITEPVAQRLRMYILRAKVVLTDVSAETRRFGIGAQ